MDYAILAGWAITLIAGGASGWFVYRWKEQRSAANKLITQGTLLKTLESRLDKHEDGCIDRNKTLHDRISNVRRELGEDIDKIDDKLGDLVVGQARIYGRLEALGKTEETQ